MEIEHLATVAEPKSGSTPGQASKNEDWKAMEQHFARISRECPALEGFAASEAIYSWLDYYSPEPMVRLEPPTVQTDETTGRWRKLRFPLRFLGDGILTDEEKVYILAVPLPVQQHQPFHTVRVLRENVVRFEQPFCQRTPLSLELTLSNRNRDQFVLELERN